MATSKQQVIFVHGTFASSELDEGLGWWQRGSEFWRTVSTKLCAEVELPLERRLFRWSGENLERARYEAATVLLNDWLRPLEAEGTSYHLVGHSHGGNVIRQAIVIAGNEQKPLRYLKSWTTVATPFVNLQPTFLATRNSLLVLAFFGFALGFCLLATLLGSWFTAPSFPALLAALLVFPMLVLVVGTVFFLTPIAEATVVNGEGNWIRDSASPYASCWLGLWSNRDEAISALMRTSTIRIPLVPRVRPKRRVFRAEIWLMGPATRLYATAFNSLFAPIADRFVRGALSQSAIGNDRPGSWVQGITPWPFESLAKICLQGLPADLDNEIVNKADEYAAKSVPRIRSLLSPNQQAVYESPYENWSLRELIHNSYFYYERVAQLIAFHINHHSGGLTANSPLDPTCAEWYRGRFGDQQTGQSSNKTDLTLVQARAIRARIAVNAKPLHELKAELAALGSGLVVC